MWCVQVTTTSDDYKRPESDSESFVTDDVNEAIGIAATQILQELSYSDFYRVEDEDSEPFVSGDPQQVWEWYQENEHLFAGEYVPSTFSVSVFRKSAELDTFDKDKWNKLCKEAQDFFGVDEDTSLSAGV